MSGHREYGAIEERWAMTGAAARVDVRRLGARARAQVEAELGAAGTRRRSQKTARSDALLACCTDGCTFGPTRSLTAMEEHCDTTRHHRYGMVLDG